MKNKIFTICLLLITSFSFSQEDVKSKFGYGFGFAIGNGTLENNQLGVLATGLVRCFSKNLKAKGRRW